jgi:long-chain acyl-CoA synthetase
LSYSALADRIRLACVFFDAHDLQPGNRITISLADEAEASATFFAALLEGYVPVMLSHEAHLDKQNAIAQSVDAALRIDKTNKPETPQMGLGRVLRLGRDRPRAPHCPNIHGGALAYILFTSGSTAKPRGVRITYANLFAQLGTLTRVFYLNSESRLVNSTPISHTDGLVQGPLLAAASGATWLRPGRFEVSRLEPWLDFIRTENATHMIANPTLLSLLLRLAQETDWVDPRHFKMVVCTGGMLTEKLWAAFEQRFGIKVCNVYGMTESVADALFAGDFPEMGAYGTIGRPIDCRARIFGGATEGELELHGANIFDGYWNDLEKTHENFSKGNWFRTGDIVRARSDGSYDFIGRVKSVINQGSVRISPEEIDEALAHHPNVIEIVTLGVPDKDFEEIAVSVAVVSRPTKEVELHKICEDRIEPLKRPKYIFILESIPRTSTGKVDRIALASWLAEHWQFKVAVENDDLTSRIFTIIADVFGSPPDQINMSSTPNDLPGWDSFNHITLIMEIETAFGINFKTQEIISIRSVQMLVNTVKSHKECTE